MNNIDSDFQLKKCLAAIESKLGWGTSVHWVNYDFTRLSDEIHRVTQVRLSMTTLKRVWGKLKYDSAPTLTTLNTLARFTGSNDWRAFCQQHPPFEIQVSKVESPGSHAVHKKAKQYWVYLAVPLVIIAFVLIALPRKDGKPDPAKFSFSADKMVTAGVPNSVVFHYDARAASTDSVFIVQTWDMTRKRLVSKSQHDHSSIYYYPGFFRAKLIADGQVVSRHDIWISSNGWLALAENEPVPLYFKKEEVEKTGSIQIDSELLHKYNVALHPKPPRIRIFNQGDFGKIMNDNFAFETTVKSDFSSGAGACQFMQVIIQCKDDVIMLPLTARSCVGNVGMYFCGESANSETSDLSKFGCDLNAWTKLRVETVNRHAVIFVNDIKAYELTFPNKPTGVVGVQYRFEGMGAVRNAQFEFGGKIVKL